MVNLGIVFIVLAALSGTAYNIASKKTSVFMHPMVGLSITSLVALLIGLISIFFLKQQNKEIQFSLHGLWYAIALGIFASGINVFYLLAYSRNAPLGLSAILATAVGTTSTVLLGLLLFGEHLNLVKLAGFTLVVLGVIVLQVFK